MLLASALSVCHAPTKTTASMLSLFGRDQAGEFRRGCGQRSPGTCAQCTKGYYAVDGFKCAPCTMSGMSGILCLDGTMKKCPAGHYCPSPTEQIVCGIGTFCKEGSEQEAPCPAGSFCPQAGLTQLKTCDPGTHCAEGSVMQSLCPSGTYSPRPEKECTNCTVGRWSKAMATSCTLCETGTKYQDNPGAWTDHCTRTDTRLWVRRLIACANLGSSCCPRQARISARTAPCAGRGTSQP